MIAAVRLVLAAMLVILPPGLANAAEPTLPALSGRVVDGAGILSPRIETEIADLLAAHERETSNQVVVATLASLQGYEIEEFAVRLFRAWKLGQQDRNNGVLLLVAPNERRVRIEVGYGLEGALPDATAHAIIRDEILPRFRAGDLQDGVVRGARAVLAAIAGTYKPRSGGFDPQYDKLGIILFAVFAAMFLYNFYYRYTASMARRRRYAGWDPYGGVYPYGRRRRRDEDGPGGFGGFGGGGGGGSSGGGFSGGGGSSGGGGASGSW